MEYKKTNHIERRKTQGIKLSQRRKTQETKILKAEFQKQHSQTRNKK